jgi:hypothetical protein
MNHAPSHLTHGFAAALADATPPCVSLYQPTHRRHPENTQDPIRFRNLLKQLEAALGKDFPAAEVTGLLEPFERLAGDVQFWNHTLDGLAVFAAPGLFRVFHLARPVDELLLVADSFHTKPLRRLLQTTDRFQVLGLSRKCVRLYEGNRDVLHEIEPAEGVPRSMAEALGEELTEPHLTVASYGGVGVGSIAMVHGHGDRSAELDIDDERFFRAVAKAVHAHHSQPSGLPLILAALPEHHALFHQVSQNPHLLEGGIKTNPEAVSTDELRNMAWEIIGPHYESRLASLAADYSQASAKDLGSDSLEQVAEAAVQGRVGSLLIEADRHLPGHLDPKTGGITKAEVTDNSVDDLLDDLADLVESKGGDVRVVPAGRMPSQSGLAATYRY